MAQKGTEIMATDCTEFPNGIFAGKNDECTGSGGVGNQPQIPRIAGIFGAYPEKEFSRAV
jgi:hypothetical protein